MQAIIQEFNKTVQAMVRTFVASVDQRIQTVNLFCLGIVRGQGSEVWIVLPKIGTQCPYISSKLPGIAMMQVADRRRQHDDIARRQPALQDQLPHKEDKRPTLTSARQSISRHERRAPPRSPVPDSPRKGQPSYF